MDNQNVENISPIYIMGLIEKIEKKLWDIFPSSKYKNVRFYIEKWHETQEDFNNYWENFTIFEDDNKNIDLLKTLHNINPNTLIKIAIDIGIETQDFIPCIPTFKNTLKDKYKSANEAFDKALTNVEKDPSIAIGLANSALESIIKEIIKEGRLDAEYVENATLYKQADAIIKAFKLYPSTNIPTEIKTIGSSLLSMCKAIEELRSSKTLLHGKTSSDTIIDTPLYAYFVVNAVTTIGLFINSYYKKEVANQVVKTSTIFDDDLPF